MDAEVEKMSSQTENSKIRIILNKTPLIWNADDWATLRKEHRIIGSLVGVVGKQKIPDALPLRLSPEEVTLLLEKQICELVQYKEPMRAPSENEKKLSDEHLERVKKEQMTYYEQKRREECMGMIDRIIEGKKRKLSQSDGGNWENILIDREAMLDAEVKRTQSTLESGVNIQIPTEDPWVTNKYEAAPWSFPESPTDHLKYRVFKDLWEKGFYVSSGSKFGGDFLAYSGDPLKFHAFYTVLCQLPDDRMNSTDLIMHSRLCTGTKKTFVLASTDDDGVVYNSFDWSRKNYNCSL